ncbi:MAG TPA: PilZ domain-containing protein [Syntrophales bacterium]|nr:PilZ domain-containing protein [Syntrophales bacterium]HOL59722.1 PilZ domain-containing protein [Syntrophales bacterium]HPO35868.1 PilZ domain-containing protein [Syntrophales bacterium]
MSEERRRRTRVPVNFTASFQRPGGDEMVVETHNISLNGMLVKSEDVLTPGTEGVIVLRLSPAVAVKIKGRVVRSAGREAAIGFTAVDETAFSHLKRIVAYNAGDADLIDAELKKAGFSVEDRK